MKMTNVLCIYHSRDIDGWLSAAIVKLAFKESVVLSSARHIKEYGWDYGKPLPGNLSDYDTFIVCDVELPNAIYEHCKQTNKNLIWLDHHFSNIVKVKDTSIDGIRDVNFAACELAWKYFFGDNIPKLITYAGLYDSYRSNKTKEHVKVLEFQYGLRSFITDTVSAYEVLYKELYPKRAGNGEILEVFPSSIILKQGRHIYKYVCSEANNIYKRTQPMVFLTNDKRYNVGIVNQERFNPINFGIDYHTDGYDAYVCYWKTTDNWVFSIYNDDGFVDVSELAKTFNGGGHKGAAGFIFDNTQFAAFVKQGMLVPLILLNLN